MWRTSWGSISRSTTGLSFCSSSRTPGPNIGRPLIWVSSEPSLRNSSKARRKVVFERKRLGRVGGVGVPGEELEPADAELRTEVELQYDPEGVHLPAGGVLSLEGGLAVVVDHQGQDRIEILQHARRRNHTLPAVEQAEGDVLGLVGQFRRHPACPGAEVDHSAGSVSRLDRLRPDDVDRRDAVAAAAPLDAALPTEDDRPPVRRHPPRKLQSVLPQAAVEEVGFSSREPVPRARFVQLS